MAIETGRLGGYRERKDTYFKDHENSPLTPDQKEIFNGLSYFPENENLSCTLEVDEIGEGVGEVVTIATVSGVEKQYVRVGRVHFPVNGEDTTLSVFQDTKSGKFFLPFRDGTSGKETYAVGRYLDPKATPDGKLVVDFNLAYNPMCAYNEGWACPIPPFENFLKVPIHAGEVLPTFVDHSDH
ncbi:MAG TPA: DUF1684 domain-containing protein [Thermomicrobiales bacterium]|nr:DUF1684 domain-containing protein [Thermomicrobiales bacterium]